MNAVVSCGEYLRQTVWPTGMAPFYTHPSMIPNGWTVDFYVRFGIYMVLLSAIMAAVVAGLFFRRSFLAVGWFWYLGTLIPVIGIIQVGTQARADRYTYLPMIGVYLMVAWLLKEVADRWPQPAPVAVVSVVALIALSVATFRQVSYWIDSYKVFEHAVQVTERNYFAFNHIGIVYDSDAKKITGGDAGGQRLVRPGGGEFPRAARSSRRLAQAGVAAPRLVGSVQGGRQEGRPGRKQALLDEFKTAARQLDLLHKQALLFDYSADAFQSAIVIKPDYDFGNNNLGVFDARRGKPKDIELAEARFKGALMSNQRDADAFNNLAIVLARQGAELAARGKLAEALEKYDEAIRCHLAGLHVRDDRASDHNNLCRVYMQKHDIERKIGQGENAERDLSLAEEQNRISLLCDQNFLGAWMSRVEICLKQAKLDEAR